MEPSTGTDGQKRPFTRVGVCFPKPRKVSWWRRVIFRFKNWLAWRRIRKKGIQLPLIKNPDSGLSIDEITCSPESQSFVGTGDIDWKRGTKYLP